MKKKTFYELLRGRFQERVKEWLLICFGEEISNDKNERNHRFLEESLELVQSLGCTISEAHQLVDYVFNREIGEPTQEVGGVIVTLAALCSASNINLQECGETELARIWTKVEKIREKQANKPKHSPLLKLESTHCQCTTEQRTGETSVMCCNHCGLPVEDFWKGEVSLPDAEEEYETALKQVTEKWGAIYSIEKVMGTHVELDDLNDNESVCFGAGKTYHFKLTKQSDVRDNLPVRIIIDKKGVLVRAGDPNIQDEEVDREILKIINEGGTVKTIPFSEYKHMKLYEIN